MLDVGPEEHIDVSNNFLSFSNYYYYGLYLSCVMRKQYSNTINNKKFNYYLSNQTYFRTLFRMSLFLLLFVVVGEPNAN